MPNLKHKHLVLDQNRIDRAKKLFGVKTEQEAIHRALDEAIEDPRILKALRKIGGVGGFDEGVFTPARRRK